MDTDSLPARTQPRGIYLLPNLLTTGCLFSGFYAIVAAIDGNFERAGANCREITKYLLKSPALYD